MVTLILLNEELVMEEAATVAKARIADALEIQPEEVEFTFSVVDGRLIPEIGTRNTGGKTVEQIQQVLRYRGNEFKHAVVTKLALNRERREHAPQAEDRDSIEQGAEEAGVTGDGSSSEVQS